MLPFIAGYRLVRGIIVANLVTNIVFHPIVHHDKSTIPVLVALVAIVLAIAPVELVDF